MPIALRAATNGNSASGTTATVTLPTYQTTDFIVLFVSSNNANAQTFSAGVTATSITSAGNRLNAWRIVPVDGAQTTFTITVGVSSVIEWWCAAYSGVDLTAPLVGSNNQIGNSASSVITPSSVTPGWVAAGSELVLAAGAVNSTATWTTSAATVFNTTANNAAMMVNGYTMPASTLAYAPATMDRGNNGSSRNQNAATILLRPTGSYVPNLLANGSFEAGTTLATSWQDEHTTVTTPTYSLVAGSDGAKAQQIAYTGVSGDASTKAEIFQSPVSGMAPGDVLTFTLDISGTMTGLYGLIGIEGFTSANAYISEADANFTTLTGTPTRYSVSYTCPPGTDHVAAYLQIPSITAGTSFNIQIERALLTNAGQATTNPVSLTGSGALAISGAPAVPASGGLAGSGSLSLNGTPREAGTAALAGSGTVAASATPGLIGSDNASGSGTLTLGGFAAAAGSVALTGSSGLTRTGQGSTQGSGTLALTGAGTLAYAAAVNSAGTLLLAGDGSATASGDVGSAGTLALTGSGTLSLRVAIQAAPTPAARTLSIPAESRNLRVPAESRIHIIPPESRIMEVT